MYLLEMKEKSVFCHTKKKKEKKIINRTAYKKG